MSKIFQEKQIFTEHFLITRKQRETMNGQRSFVVWLTGLSGAGKSTIARLLEAELFRVGIRTFVLDGDNTRKGINRDLDFSAKGRSENIRRVAEIARILNDAGIVVISAFISPFSADRKMAQSIIGKDCFVEIFVATPLNICMERDIKGLYKKALNKKLSNFTGISSPYEPPEHPALTVNTQSQPSEETVLNIVSWLTTKHYIQISKLSQ